MAEAIAATVANFAAEAFAADAISVYLTTVQVVQVAAVVTPATGPSAFGAGQPVGASRGQK